MAKFLPGNHYSQVTEFKKGGIPWNLGKHYVSLKGKWSRKFTCCRECETRKKDGENRHYASGLCRRCYFIALRRKKNPEKLKLKWRERWLRIKNNPILHAEVLKKTAEYRKTSSAYAHTFKRRKKRQRYQHFIAAFFEKKRSFKQYNKSMIITIEYEGQEYKLPTPVSNILYNMSEMFLFQKEVKRYLKKHPVDNSGFSRGNVTLDNQTWKKL